MDEKLKIAIIRGRNLNKWEMQNYEKIKFEFNITCFTSVFNRFNINGLSFPVKKSFCFDEIFDYIPGYQRFVRNDILNKKFKNLLIKYTCSDYLFNLENNLKNFDIVHTAEIYNAYTIQAVEAKKKGIIKKLIVTVWENIPYYEHLLKYDLDIVQINKNVDKFLVVSSRAAFALQIKGIESKKIEILKPGVNLNKFFPYKNKADVRKKLKFHDNSFVILSIARYDWGKGLQDLICAIALLASKKPSMRKIIKVILIGQGKLYSFLKKITYKFSVQDVIQFINHIPYEETTDWYNLADLFVLPSTIERGWQEQYGMVLVEAQACGLPVISTMTGSISEVLPEEAPKFPPSDFHSLAQLIEDLVMNPNKLSLISKACYKNALEQYDSIDFDKKIKTIYNNI